MLPGFVSVQKILLQICVEWNDKKGNRAFEIEIEGTTRHPLPATRHSLPSTRHPLPSTRHPPPWKRPAANLIREKKITLKLNNKIPTIKILRKYS